MPQRDNDIEQIHRLEGLIAYAEEQKDWDEVAVLAGIWYGLSSFRQIFFLLQPSAATGVDRTERSDATSGHSEFAPIGGGR